MGMPGIIIAVVITIDAKTMPEKAVRREWACYS